MLFNNYNFVIVTAATAHPVILSKSGTFKYGALDKNVNVTIGGEVTVFVGTTLTIRCPVVGEVGIQVYWTSDGRSIVVGKVTQVGHDLVITDIDKRYERSYTCTARTSRGTRISADSLVKVEGKVAVHYNIMFTDIAFILL